VRALGLVSLIAFVGCSDPKPVPGGGGCDYQSFEGKCALDGAPAIAGPAPDGKGVIVGVTYALPTSDRPRTWDVRWKIDAARAPRLIEHLEQHAPAPCSGRYIVRGTCTPWNATVDVPAFAGAERL